MHRKLVLCLCLLLAASGSAGAQDKEKGKGQEAKQLSGMSIVGNDEAPKSLYIVPWKRSEIGVEADLNAMLTESAVPVDREVFMRQVNFFEVSTAGRSREQ